MPQFPLAGLSEAGFSDQTTNALSNKDADGDGGAARPVSAANPLRGRDLGERSSYSRLLGAKVWAQSVQGQKVEQQERRAGLARGSRAEPPPAPLLAFPLRVAAALRLLAAPPPPPAKDGESGRRGRKAGARRISGGGDSPGPLFPGVSASQSA